jgi:uncharacterized protein YoxC
MKQYTRALALIFGIIFTNPFAAKADMFGADVAVLAQILQNAVLQLAQLKSLLQSGQDTRIDPGLYRELKNVDQALAGVEKTYGRPVDSPLAPVQRNTDQTVAEAISFNNEINEYTAKLDRIGEEIKSYSHAVSPGGAAKLTAESMGVVIHVMNQQMRATGQGLKLQAQAMAIQNKKEKDQTQQYLNESQNLKNRMTAINPTFEVPRF